MASCTSTNRTLGKELLREERESKKAPMAALEALEGPLLLYLPICFRMAGNFGDHFQKGHTLCLAIPPYSSEG